MSDKDDKQEKESRDSTESSSSSCIIWPLLLLEVPGIIIWVIWLIQGQPDNWYGKLYRFQWRLLLWLILAGILCAAIGYCVKYFRTKISSNVKKNDNNT